MNSTIPRKLFLSMSVLALVCTTLISKAENAKAIAADSFGGVSGLVERFVAQDYDSSTNTWNARIANSDWLGWSSTPANFVNSNSAVLSPSLSKLANDNRAGVNGSVTQFASVAGSATDGYLFFPGELQGLEHTIIYVARYSSSLSAKRQRILTGFNNPAVPDGRLGDENSAIGFWNDSIGFAYYGDWYTDEINPPCFQGNMYMCQASAATATYAASVQQPTDWVLVAMSENVLRVANPNGGAEIGNEGKIRINGLLTGLQSSTSWALVGYGVNVGYSARTEKSDFEIADYMVFDHSLSDAEFAAVEKELAKSYGLTLRGTAPSAPTITEMSSAQGSIDVSWGTPASAGDGEHYKYQVEYRDEPGSGWTVRDVPIETRHYDVIASDGVNPNHGTSFEFRVRAVSTTGVSPWSDLRTIQYVGYSTSERESENNSQQEIASPVVNAPNIKSAQTLSSFPQSLKRGKKLNLALTTAQNSVLSYSAAGKCKLLKTYGKVTQVVKGKRKKVKVLKKMQLKGTKAGACTLNRSAPAVGNYEAVNDASFINIK